MFAITLKQRSFKISIRALHHVSRRCNRSSNSLLSRPVLLPHNIVFEPSQSFVRYFSNEDFKSMLHRMQKNLDNQKDESSPTEQQPQENAAMASISEPEVAASNDNKSPANGNDAQASNSEDTEGSSSSSSSGGSGNSSNEMGTSSPFLKFSVPKIDVNDVVRWSKDAAHSFRENVELAYSEMMGETKDTTLKKKVQQAASFRKAGDDDFDERPAYDGPSALVVVDQPKGAWEAMKERLQDSPFIKEMLKGSRQVGKVAAETDLGKKAQNVGRSVKDKIEDAREFWETSQNPLVYTISGIWENITGQTEEGGVIAELKKLDHNFDKELWVAEVRENLAPKVLKAHLLGDTKALKPWLSEGVYSKLAADIRTRKHDGISFDTNILNFDETQVLMKFTDSGAPAVIITYMVQQIHCVRNRKGEIIEGGETDIRAKFYIMAFQQEYNEDTGYVEWKIVDYLLAGDMPYI